MILKRVTAFIFALLFVSSMALSSCVKLDDKQIEIEEQKNNEIENVAYTGGRYEMASSYGRYESFDNLTVGTKYNAEKNPSTSFGIGSNGIYLVPKASTYEIVKSDDGNALHYVRSAEANELKTDPYFDFNNNGAFPYYFVVSGDFKLDENYELKNVSMFQVIYRRTASDYYKAQNFFYAMMSMDINGNIKSATGSKLLCTLNKIAYTNIAIVVKLAEREVDIYINGQYVHTNTLPNDDITLANSSSVRVMTCSGQNGTGGIYVDNMAMYPGKYPAVSITDDSAKQTVNENFNSVNEGEYSGKNFTYEKTSAEAMVKLSSDGNKYLGVKAKRDNVSVAVPLRALDANNVVFGYDFYRPDDNLGYTLSAGDNELLKVLPNGKIKVGDKTIYITDTNKWYTLSVSIANQKLKVFINGTLYYDGDLTTTDYSSFGFLINGGANLSLYLDNLNIYEGIFAKEFSSLTETSKVIINYENIESLSAPVDKNAPQKPFTLSNDILTPEGNPTIKMDGLGLGVVLNFSLEDFDNLAKYDGIKVNMYLEDDYNYYLLVVLDCGNRPDVNGKTQWSYYYKYILLSGKGWKTFNINFETLSSSRAPARDHIIGFSFRNTGWDFPSSGKNVKNTVDSNCALEEDVILYLGSIEAYSSK